MDENKKNTQFEGKGVVRKTFETYRSEYKKIVWPSLPTLVKHTVTVVTVSLMFGVYIAVTDGILSTLFSRFVQLVS